ncbi:hypothetical protein BJS_04636 [Bradyrhizobium japonicum SEMIA 5079]|nr:hypothetical protein BJS_04636 [Bradyrhizobium japonicum SEMIA 5079]
MRPTACGRHPIYRLSKPDWSPDPPHNPTSPARAARSCLDMSQCGLRQVAGYEGLLKRRLENPRQDAVGSLHCFPRNIVLIVT